jgi:D-glycero-D-manno-heptose 1,7-bisphosphate phosphatase
MNKAVFLDRDGTINVEKNYLYKIEDFEFIPGVIEGLKLLQDAGFLLIIITNQSGIARGYYTEEDFNRLNNWMLNQLVEYGVNIAKVYYCPHLPDATVKEYRIDCECRKPKLGMYYQAIRDYDIDLGQSYAIGDKIRDCAICEQTPCRGYLIGENEKPEVIQNVQGGTYERVKYTKDLESVAKEIIGVK